MKKHSKASIVVVNFFNQNKNVKVEYSDNGIGLDKKNVKKSGLANVENRIKNINGTITFDITSNGLKVKAFHYRFKNCRSGFEVFKNPVNNEFQMMLPSRNIIESKEITERLIFKYEKMKTLIVTLLFCLSSLSMLGQEKSNKLLASNCELRGCTGSDYCTACKNCSGCAHCNSGGTCGVCSPPVKKKTIISKKRKIKRKR